MLPQRPPRSLRYPEVPDQRSRGAGASVKLQEFAAKQLLVQAGLPVPGWSVATTPAEARTQAEGYFAAGADRVVIKAQVLAGGRGKAGGVKLAASADEAEAVATSILGMDIEGITVRRVLIGAAADRTAQRIRIMGSAEGGVEIETVAETNPGAIVSVLAHPHLGLQDFQAREIAFAMGLGDRWKEVVPIVKGLFKVAIDDDADLVEINPLAIVRTVGPDGTVTESIQALDAKITLDDSALYRHPQLEQLRDLDEEDPVDVEARGLGLSFIRLDGTIGCMVNGAGLAMATMDLVKRAGGEPANFLDIGGGARSDKVAAAMRLILSDTSVRAILVNIFGGIARGDEVARGLIEARAQQTRDVPMVVRIVGTNADLAAEILRESGAGIEAASSLDAAVERVVALAGVGA
jgi:succinyl-CoA synthetase beta subunit